MPFLRSVRVGWLAIAMVAAGCAAPDDSAQQAEALTVCHSPVVEGIDVYEGNGTIDWSAVHASGREFGIARIADGLHHDSTFAANWAGMRAAGMIRGAYIFFRPTVDPNTMADEVQAAVGRLGPGDLPVTIDVECMCPYLSSGRCDSATAGCVSPSALLPVLRTLATRIETDTGKQPMIYTGAWFWDGGSYLNGAANYGSNPLWVSGYISGCVTVPSGWTDWRIWQYSDGTCTGCPAAGTPVPGVPTSPDCDRNRFAGTLADLRTFAGSGANWGAQYVMQSFPLSSVGAVQIHAGQTATATLQMRNIGSHAWDNNTRIATTMPRDRVDPFVGPDWINATRLASVPAGMTIPTGGTYTFQWTWSVPADMAPGRYDERYGMVEEGVAWFSDPGQAGPADDNLEAIIEVLPALPATDAGAEGGVDASLRDGSGSDARAGDGSASDVSGDGGHVVNMGGCGCIVNGRGHARTSFAGWMALAAFGVLGRRRASKPRRN